MVVLTSFGEVERVHQALAAGAAGYLLKDAELGRWLTAREREILALVAQGHPNRPNRKIAERLVISERTARTHVSNVLSQLQLSSRTQAALYAIREGLIPPPA